MLVKQLACCVMLLAATLPSSVRAGCETTLALVDFGRLELREGGEITGRVTVRCNAPGPFEVLASSGHGSFETREMRGPGGTRLGYNLYVDPGRTRVWGDGINAGSMTLTGRTQGRRAVDLVVYGRVFPRQSTRPGPYTDSLQITVER